MARRAGDLERARRVANAGLEARRGALSIHAALARLELTEGRGAEAVIRAETAAGRGRGGGDGLITLAAVVAEGHVQDSRLEAWDGEAARSPGQASKLALGAIASYGRGNLAGCASRLEAMRSLVRSDHQISAFHAYILARHGKVADAEATLEIAWSEGSIGPAHVAAEAALIGARGEDSLPAWRAYLSAIKADPGPVSRSQVESMISGDSGAAPQAEAEESPLGVTAPSPGAGDGESDGRLLWILGGLLALVGLVLTRRRA
jgi:hypothetical protein